MLVVMLGGTRMQVIVQIISIVYIGLIGLLIGSFLNVVIYRLPLGETIVKGRSHCPICRHDLGALDLMPVFSFLFLDRRCRYCKAPISWRYMIIEISTGFFFALATLVYQPLDGMTPLLMMIIVCTLFCILQVDSLIQYDGHLFQTRRLSVIALILAAGPLLLGLINQDSNMPAVSDRIAGLLTGTVVLLIPPAASLLNKRTIGSRLSGSNKAFGSAVVLPFLPSLPVAGLFLGLKLAWPAILICLILLLIAALLSWLNKADRLVTWLRRLLPLMAMLSFAAIALFS